jgi:hypothetical protein
VTHVAHNTRYEQIVIQGWVSYVNRSIKIGNYKGSDLVNIDETNVDFDLASKTKLAGCGEHEKLPPFLIYKGGNAAHCLIKHEWKDFEAIQKYGYPEGQVYTVQEKAWMGEQSMMKWLDEV